MKCQVDYQNFTERNGGRRVTKWVRNRESLTSLKSFGLEGRDFIIKSDRRKIKPKWAIFVRKQNKLRRQEDLTFKKDIDIAGLALMALPSKREGICILSTILTCLKLSR